MKVPLKRSWEEEEGSTFDLHEWVCYVWSFPNQRQSNVDGKSWAFTSEPLVFRISSSFPNRLQIRGTGPGGQLQDLDCSSSDDEGAVQNSTKPSATKGTLGGMFGMLKGLVGSKSLSREDMESVLDKMRDHLIGEF